MLKPSAVELQRKFERAAELHRANRLAEAEALYRQLLAAKPRHAPALHLLGVVMGQRGRFAEAVELIGKAIAIEPATVDYYLNRCGCRLPMGKLDEAVADCRKAIALQPELARGHYSLGVALAQRKDHDEAIAAYRRALELDSACAEAHANLAVELASRQRLEEAIPLFQRAIGLAPHILQLRTNLGLALFQSGRIAEAKEQYRLAMQGPGCPDAHANLAAALCHEGSFAEALAECQKAIAMAPELPTAHLTLANVQLLLGDFERGWTEYEWRVKDTSQYAPNTFSVPPWRGEEAKDRTILLHAEQGLGDTLQFIRYAAMVSQRVGQVVTHVPEGLVRLLGRVQGVGRIMTGKTVVLAFDLHCSLLSLPYAFGTTAQSIPAPLGYVRGEEACAAKWARRLGERDDKLRVGLCWAGNPEHRNDRQRSLSLSQLAPLAGVRGVRFYSLQKGPGSEQAKDPPAGMELADFTAELSDFEETAGLVANLDLVISVDTAVGHLAGAMGQRCWVLLPLVPDWRWQLQREDSPWYPTLRLFRQKQAGDWAEVVQRVAQELTRLARQADGEEVGAPGGGVSPARGPHGAAFLSGAEPAGRAPAEGGQP